MDTFLQRLFDSTEMLAFQDKTATPVQIKQDSHVVQSWSLGLSNVDALRSMHPSVLNAGGSSEYSEALSIDLLAEKLGAQSVQLEMEVEYWFDGKMFDFVATKADGTTVAVSVTRVLDHAVNTFCAEKTHAFLKKKTDGMLMAARSMRKVADQFVLHVWVPSKKVADECAAMAKDITSPLPDCTLWITVCAEPDIYTNKCSRVLRGRATGMKLAGEKASEKDFAERSGAAKMAASDGRSRRPAGSPFPTSPSGAYWCHSPQNSAIGAESRAHRAEQSKNSVTA